MNDDWDAISYVISSRYRIEVLRHLADGPSTPSTIAEDTGNSIAHVSRALGDLRGQGLVNLLVSEDRTKGRVYGVTQRGETVWSRIEAENLV